MNKENYFESRRIFLEPPIPESSQFLPDLSRKTVLVMGGSRGIGAEVARLSSEQGAHVVTVSRHKERPVVSNLHIKADLTEPWGVRSVWGKEFMVDIVFNNIGLYEQRALADTDLSRWNQVMTANLTSMFLLNKEASRKIQDDGVIINMASRPTLDKYAEWSAYTIAKQGVITLTKAVAEESGRGIHAYAICPSRVDTWFREELFPDEPKEQRLTAEDTAMSIMFLMNKSLPNGSHFWIKQLYG